MRVLYTLHLLTRGDSTFAGEQKQDRSLWGRIISDYLAGRPFTGSRPIVISEARAERLMLMDEHEAYRFARYAEAQQKVKNYASHIHSPQGHIAHMTDQMNLRDQQGHYQKELSLLDQVEQAEVSLGASREEVHAQYAIARYRMRQDLQQQAPVGAGSSGTTAETADSSAATEPVVTAFKAPYPNPFNPATTIRYRLSQQGPVQLSIYNATGRRVAVLVDTRQSRGLHEVRFNAAGLSSGLYFCRLTTTDRVLTRKMLFLK